ncbi:hypothetical protein JCM19239_3158 [Vibrio variabilis]|uniref:Uncharacterized protein n=1 Tax=Vibrio variabilis TaxID=990271 RepID=A0ABQ0JR90_9VIBR|nr:hypothetical protein JCM19239_3158 [Vibrio variabilis]
MKINCVKAIVPEKIDSAEITQFHSTSTKTCGTAKAKAKEKAVLIV